MTTCRRQRDCTPTADDLATPLDEIAVAQKLLDDPALFEHRCAYAAKIIGKVKNSHDLCEEADLILVAMRGLYRLASEKTH